MKKTVRHPPDSLLQMKRIHAAQRAVHDAALCAQVSQLDLKGQE